ncbi:MAG: tRNA preQ1(34) S-adenosylmethionine ribosyltransferase-isomerase QueA [Gammaproteobacteria bacterium]|nr:tRNA preQ1(34) S-adenosylmethionine ribosyltransferase-isomerase QueA [Gammaproteobacteria bacterium]
MKAGRNAIGDFGYHLPEDRIARYPAARRDRSRLLVAPRSGRPFEHRVFRDLPGLMRAGDVLVVNESRVLPVRLLGAKPTGARAEVFLLRPLGQERLWEALVRPGGKLKPGRTVEVAPDLVVHIVDSTPDHGRIVRVETPLPVEEALERHGRVPLPPYLRRRDEPVDRARYQTVYARTPGSVAAPTAGLHFTRELMEALEAGGVRIARVTLHVGVATFRPAGPAGGDPRGPGEERYRVPREAAIRVAEARAGGGRVWAVGTTVVRTLESAGDGTGGVRAGAGTTDLFIRPPFDFRVVDALITNFHLPHSTLLMLVAAFAGHERTMDAYREAIDRGYRFYSYGDAMAIA